MNGAVVAVVADVEEQEYDSGGLAVATGRQDDEDCGDGENGKGEWGIARWVGSRKADATGIRIIGTVGADVNVNVNAAVAAVSEDNIRGSFRCLCCPCVDFLLWLLRLDACCCIDWNCMLITIFYVCFFFQLRIFVSGGTQK